MKYIIGKNRSQMEFYSLEELISQDNEVRLIDLFVDSLPLPDFGFKALKQNEQGGRPAGDGTKLRAQNSKKNNFNQKKIDRHLAYIESKLDEYNAILAQEDGDAEQKTNAQKKIEEHLLHKQKSRGTKKARSHCDATIQNIGM